ncbi:MAG: family 10 glycosylhydrolase [Faecalibacterium sp.]|nr:family 10 glycosylhydrolase [Ruminococcus sp.]MCM1391505.1 family 10 glycosylhydrolase [Ruminococcus sp.]MCM1485869.1 family 10 glycosylhydrolase [Faecalibacterium sp.]
MKRLIILLVCVMLCFCGCDSVLADENETLSLIGNNNALLNDDDKIINDDSDNFFIGAWLSYMELMPKECADQQQYEEYISDILDNLKQVGVTDLFVHVRAFADAIYPSEFFPSSEYVAGNQGDKLPFDVLDAIIKKASEREIKVHAWLNPYRVQREFDESKLCDESIAKKWLKAGSDNVVKAAGGLYFEPSSSEVQKLILDGVRELLDNYDIAGIHIDDYFYPTSDESFDKKQFKAYRKSGGELSLPQWRRENVSNLVSGIYSTVKLFSDDKIFSISPSGDIDKTRDEMFADVELWCSQSGYCDMIIPQIYYGFDNESMPFEQCAIRWKSITCEQVKLVVGLALYKSGKEDSFAGESGKNEWLENDDVIKRQAEFLNENDFDGFSLYSAKFVNFNKNIVGKQSQNLKVWYNTNNENL